MDVRWGEQKEVDRKRRKTIDDIMVAGGRELIDTLWNVNLFPLLFLPSVFRINRYIMECKYSIKEFGFTQPVIELIDTLWNVNL